MKQKQKKHHVMQVDPEFKYRMHMYSSNKWSRRAPAAWGAQVSRRRDYLHAILVPVEPQKEWYVLSPSAATADSLSSFVFLCLSHTSPSSFEAEKEYRIPSILTVECWFLICQLVVINNTEGIFSVSIKDVRSSMIYQQFSINTCSFNYQYTSGILSTTG